MVAKALPRLRQAVIVFAIFDHSKHERENITTNKIPNGQLTEKALKEHLLRSIAADGTDRMLKAFEKVLRSSGEKEKKGGKKKPPKADRKNRHQSMRKS